MIHKRGLKGLVIFILLLILTFLFSAAAAAATVKDIKNNSLRIGDDIYELNNTNSYTYENVLDSINRGGSKYYFKIDSRWYDLLRDDINTLSDLLDPAKAVPAAEVRIWLLTYRYGSGDTPEVLEPLASTYIFDYGFPDEAILEEEDTSLTVALCTDEQGAVGYDTAYIAFSAAGPGDVTFKTVDGEGKELIYENEGAGDALSLPTDYSGSTDWTLCFTSPGDYTITFKLMDPATGKVIAEGIQRVSVYPSRETVLADVDARILAAIEALELDGTGVSEVAYAERSALVCIDEPGRIVADFMESVVGTFKEPFADVTGAEIYVGGEKAGAIENPAAMSDAALIDAIGQGLIQPLIGGGKRWSEATLGDLDGKSVAVRVTVVLGAARYSAVYGVSFAVNKYIVSVAAENGTVEGTGSYAVGAQVSLAATAGADYEFYNWSDGEGEEVSRSNPYTFAMPNRNIELAANFFRSEATIDTDSALSDNYVRVHVVDDDITVDLCGNTVVNLSVNSSNVTLKNGTVVNLTIGRGVENVILEDISDGEGGNHIFAGSGSSSIVLKGNTTLKGTVYITSRDALGISSVSSNAMIGGNVAVKTIMPVTINAPVQGEVRVLASSEPIIIKSEVARITALANTVIKISSSIDESKRPQVEKAAGVEVSVSIVDEHGEETGDTEDVEVGEGLSPADIFIFSIAPIADEIRVNGSYALPAAVEAVLSDRTTEDVAVDWGASAVDTGEAGRYVFDGTVEGYDDVVEFALKVYITHMVAFEVDGGSAVGEQEIRHGETAEEPIDPTRRGYTFGGWFKDGAFNHAWSFTEERVTEALTLYARWIANTYEVTFDAKGGDRPSPASMSATYDSTYGELAVTSREGYTFAGWFTEAVGGSEITGADRVSTAGDHTLYAHWNINQYTITFDSAGGSEIDPLIQDYGTAIIAPANPVREGYNFMGWQPVLPATMPAENLKLTAQWSIKTYTVTFNDHDGRVIDTQTVKYGSAATAPAEPERAGYAFNGWDTCFSEVKSDLMVTAKYIDQLLAGIRDLIDSAGVRTRPGYTAAIVEWDDYWNSFLKALSDAEQLYDDLKETELLTEEQKLFVTSAKKDLQRAVEILDGIEDFDMALGGRVSPKGLVETVYERSLVDTDPKFQPHRLRCYYEKESGDFYWMLSGYIQEQDLWDGTTGTGMNPGLQNVMLSESIIKLQSGEHIVNIYKKDGTRKTQKELETDGIALAIYWLTEAGISPWIYANLVGLVEDCKLIGITSDGVEFERTYTFRFVDADVHLFDPNFRYCVVDGVVQRDFEGYNIINATRGLKYADSAIQTAINEAEPGDYIHVTAGSYNEGVTINKSINLIGSYRQGVSSTVLNGEWINDAPGILIAEAVSDVTIKGFEIKNFVSGGIVGEGNGLNNITIENNYIHDVGNDGVLGGAGDALTGWTVVGNRIEGFGGSGVILENVGELAICNNAISNPVTGDGFAIGVTARADLGSMTVLGITISCNEVSEGAVNLTVLARGSGTVTAKEVTINKNIIVDGSIEVRAGVESSQGATIENVNISDNNIAFQDKGVSIKTRADTPGSAHIKNVRIERNEMTGHFTGIDLHTQGSGYHNLRNFTITCNRLAVSNPEAAGCAVNLADIRGTSSFTNNTITITGNAGDAFDGIDISGSITSKWTITDNVLNGNNVGIASSGIHLRGNLPATVDLTMTKNTITGWAQGILADDLTTGVAVKIHHSRIYGNSGFGISNGFGAAIDATLNFWGHASGPLHELNQEGLGNAVTDNVFYNPWYIDEECETLSD